MDESSELSGPEKHKRPVLGFLWGIVFGLGLAICAVNFEVIELSLVPVIVVLVLGIIVGVAWSIFGPAKKPKGMTAPG